MSVCVETFVLTCRSGSVPQVVAALEAPLVGRAGFLGCWTTELGILNQVVVMFEKLPDDIVWPGSDHGVQGIVQQEWTLHAGTSPQPGLHGGAYEWRLYDILDGCEAQVVGLMEASTPARAEISPAYAVMTASQGASRLLHIWPYADLADRAAKRKLAVESGAWPPKNILPLLGTMQSSILTPVAFSPSR
ncbi:NIPSNAP family protein [Asaia bogorensis]|uniref:NIPSNAP family protein n=1 Tax=Asaia bogorensis TaxID=91915 RepID=UPI000EFB782E|nr:NIPSNAP family protein [Asaia bogorensis]